MKRILLLGANGQVGFELARVLPPLGDLVCATRSGRAGTASCERVDLADVESTMDLLDRVEPDVIVNAAAWTAVDRAEDEPEQVLQLNAQLPALLGACAAQTDASVIHYSTDYVFDGKGDRPWREDDATAPLGVYGQSKLAGERALAGSDCRHLILRTAWVYAARGHNFLLTMLRLARERDTLRVVADQHGAPTPAPLIAAATAAVLARWLALDEDTQAARSGVYHLTSAGSCTWHGFAEVIFERAAAAGLIARRPTVQAIGSNEFPTPAQRPHWSVLDNTRLRETFDVALPDWQRGLDRVLSDLAAAAQTTMEK